MFDGQSLNNLPTAGVTSMPAQVMDGRVLPWTNVAVSGTSWSALAATVTDRRNPVLNHTRVCVLMMNGGTSDFITDHDSAATALADAGAYAASARAAFVGDAIRVIGYTVPPATLIVGADEVSRVAYNELVRASPVFDAVVDLAADPALDDNLDLTYYSDGLHWTPLGASIAAGLVDAALDAVLATL